MVKSGDIEVQGQIEGGTVYSLDRFMLVTGLKKVALDSVRRISPNTVKS